jgi:hypothetical protein
MYARIWLNENRNGYFSLSNCAHKRGILLASIVDTILEQGHFLKREGREWVPVAREQALMKTAHAIRYQQRKSTFNGTKESDFDGNQAPLLFFTRHDCTTAPIETNTSGTSELESTFSHNGGFGTTPHGRLRPNGARTRIFSEAAAHF